jgi:SAM-dependent methyltransferase
MYGKRPLANATRAARAIATNQLARFFPSVYFKATRDTGRGPGLESPSTVAAYFWRCFDDYLERLSLTRADARSWLSGKRIVEYGPGDLPGVALLFVAHGAKYVKCVDRFPLLSLSEFNTEVLDILMAGLAPEERRSAASCFKSVGDIASGFNDQILEYCVTRDGLSGAENSADLVISRAVLEHVNDLSGTFEDMRRALKPGGLALHQIDLKSHRLHESNPLDFLTWPDDLWKLMFSHKGAPNRLRPDAFRAAIAGAGLEVIEMRPTGHVPQGDIDEVRPYLAARFRDLSDDDLGWLGFWLMCRRVA